MRLTFQEAGAEAPVYLDLGYCTNIHRGESWAETFSGLRDYTLRVRERVVLADDEPYGIGLRLGADAADELASDSGKLDEFRRWLDDNHCYVFTINGFPYGKFHGTRVKEQVYVPDWSRRERLDYTVRLFDLLDRLAPAGAAAGVSTLPGSFKEFITADDAEAHRRAMHEHLIACHRHVADLAERSGRDLHLGLEPEPLGLFETTPETVEFFGRLSEAAEAEGIAERDLKRTLGVNYDTCHLAIEFEEPTEALGRLRDAGIRISKIHLSSALKLAPAEEPGSLERLRAFEDEVYLHQVVVREGGEVVRRFRDLPDALDDAAARGDRGEALGDEWRVHFHVPIHAQPEALFGDTRDHISGTLAVLAADPGMCSHFEMETYTWEVLPEAMRAGNVVDQLGREYEWCLGEFAEKGFSRVLP